MPLKEKKKPQKKPQKKQEKKPEKKVENVKQPKISEEKMLRIIQAKEQRDMDTYYKLTEVEPEEETLEQKIRRNKKELLDNTKK